MTERNRRPSIGFITSPLRRIVVGIAVMHQARLLADMADRAAFTGLHRSSDHALKSNLAF
jgi:hypothetical protein